MYYAKLVGTLPMNDDVFVSALCFFGLLSDDLRDQLQSEHRTSADKAILFLDSVIESSVTSGIGNAFSKLLIVMEGCDDESVKELAKLIGTKLRTPYGENSLV